jgi:hypothetical protein
LSMRKFAEAVHLDSYKAKQFPCLSFCRCER